ncbi:hypothetical protein RMSM_04971 [Rhodopirellula maiorica SM1]|uniref:Uncharacterized protein n=1 Tax=Rhodopirellula maiorica SM1 TaxID=1265738 RepID=M5RRT1_9BACT|nr:hypothetical protein RMSM_04971 [Rhodopirellula maiorica SM1]
MNKKTRSIIKDSKWLKNKRKFHCTSSYAAIPDLDRKKRRFSVIAKTGPAGWQRALLGGVHQCL